MSKLRIATSVFITSAILLALFLWHSKNEATRAQAARDQKYRATLGTFQRDLRLGMHRSEVYDYLRFHSVQFGERNDKDALVPIGRDPARSSSICEFYYVSVLFEFNELPHQQEPSQWDNLRDISIDRDCQK
jgi:hypothetical protein